MSLEEAAKPRDTGLQLPLRTGTGACQVNGKSDGELGQVYRSHPTHRRPACLKKRALRTRLRQQRQAWVQPHRFGQPSFLFGIEDKHRSPAIWSDRTYPPASSDYALQNDTALYLGTLEDSQRMGDDDEVGQQNCWSGKLARMVASINYSVSYDYSAKRNKRKTMSIGDTKGKANCRSKT